MFILIRWGAMALFFVGCFVANNANFVNARLTDLLRRIRPRAEVCGLSVMRPNAPLPAMGGCGPTLKGKRRRTTAFVCYSMHRPVRLRGMGVAPSSIVFGFTTIRHAPNRPSPTCFRAGVHNTRGIYTFTRQRNVQGVIFADSVTPCNTTRRLGRRAALPVPGAPCNVSGLITRGVRRA